MLATMKTLRSPSSWGFTIALAAVAGCSADDDAREPADDADDDAETPRVITQPNFTNATRWSYVGVVATENQGDIGEQDSVISGEIEDTSSSTSDPPAVRALHRPIVIEDATWRAYEQIIDNPSAGMTLSDASSTVTGTQGLYPDETELDVIVGPESGDSPCEEEGVECNVLGAGDGRTLRDDNTVYPWKATVGLYGRASDGTYPGPGACSGTFIGPRHVLTSAHCVWNRSNSTLTPVVVVPGLDGVGGEPYGKKGVKYYYIPKGYWQDDSITQEYDRRYDYALLVLWDDNFSNGWYGFASKSYSNLKNTEVWTAGRPKRDLICADSPRADDKCWRFLYADDCDIGHVYTGYIKYGCDTDDGQSGSPAYHFNGGNRLVVGIHKGFFGSGWNGGNRIRDSNFDALCEAIHDNQTNHAHDCY